MRLGFLGLLLVAAVAGCSRPQTGTLSGSVTVRGKPVASGTVVVSRGDGDYRNVHVIPFTGGRYTVSNLVLGDYWVTLTDTPGVGANRDGEIPGLPLKTLVVAGENPLDVTVAPISR